MCVQLAEACAFVGRYLPRAGIKTKRRPGFPLVGDLLSMAIDILGIPTSGGIAAIFGHGGWYATSGGIAAIVGHGDWYATSGGDAAIAGHID